MYKHNTSFALPHNNNRPAMQLKFSENKQTRGKRLSDSMEIYYMYFIAAAFQSPHSIPKHNGQRLTKWFQVGWAS